jgi:glycosyltransferase involved in cell wall biosynthesis
LNDAAQSNPQIETLDVEVRPDSGGSVAPVPVSVIIPAYNEENSIGGQIEKIQQVFRRSEWPFELIVVDDGSTDRTADAAARSGVHLVRLARNRGYGAALKAGMAGARHQWILIIDADGTYPAEAIPALLERMRDADMVVGARVGERVSIPWVRRPAKWFLGRLAAYLAEQEIPDLNSGLRVFKKSLAQEYLHLLPSGFSFTTTITLALACTEHAVVYVPIDYHKRVGESKIRPRHAYEFLLIILRAIVYFNPLRVFLPAGALFFLAGVAKFIYDIFLWNLSESAVMFILSAVVLWATGLLADQMSRINLAHRSK